MKRSVLLLVAALAGLLMRQRAHAQVAGGSGTPEDPYRIETAAQLDAVRWALTAHFRLTGDIDLGVAPWNEGAGWAPVGTTDAPFTGTFDGAGFAVRNLTINRTGTIEQGLFGWLVGATVRNLRLENVSVSGGEKTGGLAGSAAGGSFETVQVTGAVTGDGMTGGIVGCHDGPGSFVRVSFAGEVRSTAAAAGGLAGYLCRTTVLCTTYVAGEVQGTTAVGGLVGQLIGSVSDTEISDSYSRASVCGTNAVGGCFGELSYSHARRCYSGGPVSGASATGGFLGAAGTGAKATDCYWDLEVSGQATSALGEGRSSGDMRQRATYATYNFNTLWCLDEGVDTPRFQPVLAGAAPATVGLIEIEGEGTPAAPYLLRTADELNALRQNLGAHYRLANDIDLAATVSWNDGLGWEPVGSAETGQRFTGTLDGAGFAIRNLTVNRPESGYLGLFGYIDGGTVRDLRLENANVYGYSFIGALAGKMEGGHVQNVDASGEIVAISTSSTVIGGLAGYQKGGTLSRVSFAGSIRGAADYSGGLVGYAVDGAVIRHASAMGSVEGRMNVGGLAGYLTSNENDVEITDSYSGAAVFGNYYVGGAFGVMRLSRACRCYSSGAVTATGGSAGGFLAYSLNSNTVDDCYWDTETSGQASGEGGEGLTTAQMRQRATYANYNFYTLWRIDEGAGYPVFQEPPATAGPAALTLAELEGAGTSFLPYLIGDADGLNALRLNPAAYYRLTNDIDLSASVVWDAGAGWLPVGTAVAPFSGTLDGAGFAIRYLTVNRPGCGDQGLFGRLSVATVRDLRLEYASVNGGERTGALAGTAGGSVVENVRALGEVTGAGTAGGLVGQLNGGTLRQVSFAGSVLGRADMTGGLVGHASDGAVLRHAFSTGRVRGAAEAGGLVGRLSGTGTPPLLADSYSRASVSGTNVTGGCVGRLENACVSRCYSTGPVTGAVACSGGFLGCTGTAATVADCYWDTETSGQASGAGGEGRTTAQMRQRATYANYNFYTLWRLEEGAGYPAFQEMPATAGPAALTLAELEGAGTSFLPYLIGDADGLNAMRLNPAAHYRLTNDVDLSASVVWDAGAGWQPVGTAATPFSGTLDGAGFAIRYLSINRPTDLYQGLFGRLNGATVRNLRLACASVRGSAYSGTLAGNAAFATIENVRAEGEVTGTGYTGGLAGLLNGGTLNRTAFAGAVRSAAGYAGGLVGYASGGGAISGSYVLGSVRGTSDVGGLAGGLSGSYPVLSDSYSRAAVFGTNRVGGLVGALQEGGVCRTYSSGAVSGTGSFIGGFLGYTGTASEVTDCYWDTNTSAQAASAAGTGLATGGMQQQDTFTNWNFTAVWTIEEDVSYPSHLLTEASMTLAPILRRHRNDASAGQGVEVLANTAWGAATEYAWITITGGADGRDSGTVVYSVASNPVPTLRTGTITVSNGVEVSQTFTVYQGAELTLAPADGRHDAAASGGHAIAVGGNVAWQADVAAGWLVLAGATGGAAGTGTVVYAVTENLSLAPRTNAVIVSGGGLAVTCTVAQAGAPRDLAIAPEWREHSAAGAAGQAVAVTANTAWTATNDVGWLTLTGGEEGSGDGAVLYAVAPSATHTSRLGHVIVSDGVRTLYHRVWQVASNTVLIRLSVEPAGSGALGGGGRHLLGQHVAVSAWDTESHRFEAWLEEGTAVSTNAVYIFDAAADRHLTARFQLRTFALNYFAGAGGALAGETAQIVGYGSNGTAVVAQPDAGAVFHAWSDGGSDGTRTDTDTRSNLTVTARFRSACGADLDWYAGRGFTTGAGEDWTDVDARAVPDKGTTLLHENIADTDPADTNDVFRVTAISNGPPVTVAFTPASAARAYTLQATTNLVAWPWEDVPGQGPRPGAGGAGGADAMSDEGAAPARFYRVKVQVP